MASSSAQDSASQATVVMNVPSLIREDYAADKANPEPWVLNCFWAVAPILGLKRLCLFRSHARSHYRFDLGQCDQTTATQTIPGCHRGRVDAGARIRLRRVHY